MPPSTDDRDDVVPLEPGDVDSGDAAASASAPLFGRVSQACVACRRKKVKCDGNSPCYNCSTREQSCEYPGTRDNASVSRRYAASFEARCQQMDVLCQRLEGLAGQLAESIAHLHQGGGAHEQSDGGAADLLQAAQVLRSMPAPIRGLHEEAGGWLDTGASGRPASRAEAGISSGSDKDDGGSNDSGGVDTRPKDSEDTEDTEDTEDNEPLDDGDPREDDDNCVGALVRDSYGRLRFMGGATNQMLLEAVKSLSPGGPVSASSTPNAAGVVPAIQAAAADLEIPLFIHGTVWPELPYLPKPEQLSRPPKYVADLLINLYFDQLHYTFPVLLKSQFMEKYRKMLRPGPDAGAAGDRRFLMVFFAVCACASGLLPGPTDRRFAGLEYYEKALLLCYAANGEASLERVQCLALLAMCAAGWNTLTQSWMLAGQAVRAAQDIGLHLSRPWVATTSTGSERGDPSGVLRQQVARRVWWSIYNLDRVISICLGRPMATSDEDCDCDLPFDMNDEQLESYAQWSRPNGSSAITGFIAFSRLCRIAGKIQQLHAPQHLRELTSNHTEKRRRFLAQVAAYDKSLTAWVESLPDEIRFSANALGNGPTGSVDLTMCVIIFIVHAGSLLNLYRCLVGHHKNASLLVEGAKPVDAVSQCISAAKSCINAAELVRDLVPPSHHLAFCVYYLTLSGVVLLRMPTIHGEAETLADVEKCVQLLAGLEPLWSGAARGRAIVAQLLAEHRNRAAKADAANATTGPAAQELQDGAKRSFTEYLDDERGGDPFLWHHIPGSELFSFELSGVFPL